MAMMPNRKTLSSVAQILCVQNGFYTVKNEYEGFYNMKATPPRRSKSCGAEANRSDFELSSAPRELTSELQGRKPGLSRSGSAVSTICSSSEWRSGTGSLESPPADIAPSFSAPPTTPERSSSNSSNHNDDNDNDNNNNNNNDPDSESESEPGRASVKLRGLAAKWQLEDVRQILDDHAPGHWLCGTLPSHTGSSSTAGKNKGYAMIFCEADHVEALTGALDGLVVRTRTLSAKQFHRGKGRGDGSEFRQRRRFYPVTA